MIVMRDDAKSVVIFLFIKTFTTLCVSLSFFAIDSIEINQIDFKQYAN